MVPGQDTGLSYEQKNTDVKYLEFSVMLIYTFCFTVLVEQYFSRGFKSI